MLRLSPASVIPLRLHTTSARSLTSSAVGRQNSHVARTQRLVWATLTAMGLGRTLLAALQREKRLMAKSKRGEGGTESRGVSSVCLSISVFTFTAGNASSTTCPAPLDHLHCRIAEHRLGKCLNAPTRSDRVGWQQPACVTNRTLSSSVPTFRRNLLLPSSGMKCAHIHSKLLCPPTTLWSINY